jgi:hypothetical protein
MKDPKNPQPGDLVIDASGLDVVDTTADMVNKLIKVRKGIGKAVANVERLKPEEMRRAGINPLDVDQVRGVFAQYRLAEALLPAVQKLAELVHETKAYRGHEISQILGDIAAQARRRGERDPNGAEILGPLADLFEYQYGPAKKAVATRKKAKAKAEAKSTPTE